MNKEIKKVLGEIVFIIIFLIIVIPVYLNNDINDERKRLKNINSLSLTKTSSTLYTIPNNDITNIEEEKVSIVNTYIPTNYELYLMYNKTSSTNLDNLKVRIDNSIYYLKEMYNYEDNEHIYFLLDNNYINKYKEYLFNIWLEENNNNRSQIKYSLLIKKI